MENEKNLQINEQPSEQQVAENNVKVKKFTPLKVIWIILTSLLTAWLLWGLFDVIGDMGKENWQIGLAFYLAILVIIFGGIGYGVLFIIGLAGTIFSATNLKNGTPKGTLICFIIMTVLPIILFVGFYVACYILAS